jgi:heptosyltransferase II
MSPADRAQVPGAAARAALVVRLCNWVGEVVLSLPALQRLAAAGYDLHLVGKRWAPALLEGSGWPVDVRAPSLLAATRQLRGLGTRLAAQYGHRQRDALLMTRSLSSALESRFGGFRPAGFAYDGRSLLLRQAFPYAKFPHASQDYWQLVSDFLGVDAPYPLAVDLPLSAAQVRAADALLVAHALETGAFVVLCPFSGPDDREHRKVWPSFPALARWFKARAIPTMICPGPGEEALCSALPGVIALPGVDLGTYAALCARARVVIANDTGPGHLAAAVGAKLVSLYGPHSSARWTPIGTQVCLLHADTWPGVERVAETALGES